MASEITIKIGGDSKELTKEVEKVKKALKDFGDEGEKSIEKPNLAMASFIGNIASDIVLGALNKLVDLFGSVAGAAIEFAGAAEEDAKALNQLNIALAQTGQYSAATASQMEMFANELGRSSQFSSVAIAQTAAYIQQVARLSSTELPRATQATSDFASALGIDIDSAGKVVGRALSGNVEALGKYGIELKSTGDKAKDMALVLEALESRFGGASVASIQTFSGATAQLKNSYEDLGKAIFGQLTQTPAVIGAISGINAIFQELKKIVDENQDAIKEFITDGVLFFVDGISVAAGAITLLMDAFTLGRQAFASFEDFWLMTVQNIVMGAELIVQASVALTDFFGVTTEIQKSAAETLRTVANTIAEVRAENQAETEAMVADNETRTQAITDFAARSEEAVRASVESAKAAEGEKTAAMLEEMNVRGQIAEEQRIKEDEEAIAKKELAILQSEENLAFIQDVLGKEAALREQARIQELTKTGSYAAALKQQRAAMTKAEQEQIFAVQKFEDLSQKQRLANLQSTLGTIATLQSSGSKELFIIGKAAAIGTATIDGIQAVQKALASAPPPLNFALAAVVGVATAANIAKIASTPAPTGAADGAFVNKGIPGMDDQPFMLSRGEVVAPARDFDDVVEGTARQRGFIKPEEDQGAGANGGGAQVVNITINGDILADDSYVNQLAEKLADVTRFRNGPLLVRS